MTPDEQPPVVLPPCPEGFVCHFQEDLESPLAFFPNRRPRSAYGVAAVEWLSDAPIAGTYDTYYLSTNRRQTLWFLWLNCWDDFAETQHEDVCAYGPKAKVSPYVAAVHLLMAAWKGWHGDEPPPFMRVTGEGLLSAPEVKAIARELWPGCGPVGSSGLIG